MIKFRVEKGEEVCYVQIGDIVYMANTMKIELPNGLKRCNDVFSGENFDNLYARVNVDEDVNFLKQQFWIINADKIDSLSTDTIKQIHADLLDKISIVVQQIKTTVDKDALETLEAQRSFLFYELNVISNVIHERPNSYKKIYYKKRVN